VRPAREEPQIPPSGDGAASFLEARRDRLAEAITDEHFLRVPGLATRYGEVGRARCTEDACSHLDHLRAAVVYGSPELFVDYVIWVRGLLAARGVPDADLLMNVDVIRTVLGADASMPGKAEVMAVLGEGTAALSAALADIRSHLDSANPHAALARRYLDALRACDRRAAATLVLDAVAGGLPVQDVYLHVFQATQYELGRLWQLNRISVAEEHYCTAATQLVMSQLYPRLFSTARVGRRIVVACAAGELHELGARMVADFFEMEGWDTFYLGANTPAPGLVSMVLDRCAHAVALSASLTGHVGAVADLVRAIRAQPEAASVRIFVGGHPFNSVPELVRKVGADGSAHSAREALALGRSPPDDGGLR
jgi:methanogenic corrinoid protein MtbC1